MARRLALVATAAAATAVLWIGGSIALAQYTEDLCFDDADLRGYGGYTQTVQTWPPSLQCVLRGGSDQPSVTVDHRFLGAAISAWRYVFPFGAAFGLAVFTVAPLNRRAGRTAAGR